MRIYRPIHAYCCQNDKCVDETRRVLGVGEGGVLLGCMA